MVKDAQGALFGTDARSSWYRAVQLLVNDALHHGVDQGTMAMPDGPAPVPFVAVRVEPVQNHYPVVSLQL